jgi:hypothetical protein
MAENNWAKTFLYCIEVIKAEEKVWGFLELEDQLPEERLTEGRLTERHQAEECLAEGSIPKEYLAELRLQAKSTEGHQPEECLAEGHQQLRKERMSGRNHTGRM